MRYTVSSVSILLLRHYGSMNANGDLLNTPKYHTHILNTVVMFRLQVNRQT